MMPSADRLEATLIERHSMRWLLFLYCLFILYGTFIPFKFTDDAEFVHSQWARFLTPPYVAGVRQFSLSDVVSNVLLFVPFGFLWIGSEIGKGIVNRLWAAFFVVGALGGLFGLAIEIGQLFSPGRISSLLDAACNGSGAALGGLFGNVLFRLLRGRIGTSAITTLRERPSLWLLGLYLCAYIVDAFYPFDVTLDVSTVWENVKHARWIPFAGGAHLYWLDLLVEKVLLFAAIGYLARVNLQKSLLANRAFAAWWLCAAVSFVIEIDKLFFVGRSPNAENFFLSAFGTMLGVIVVYPLARTSLGRRGGFAILMASSILVIAWAELSPFDWVGSVDEFYHRLDLIEWVPFSAYYGADPRPALFDLLKKLLIAGPFGFLLAIRLQSKLSKHPRLIASFAGLALGALFEAMQIGLRSHTPSTTDVLLFGLASWFGLFVFEKFSQLNKFFSTASNPYGNGF
jgi:VanZ family protein